MSMMDSITFKLSPHKKLMAAQRARLRKKFKSNIAKVVGNK